MPKFIFRALILLGIIFVLVYTLVIIKTIRLKLASKKDSNAEPKKEVPIDNKPIVEEKPKEKPITIDANKEFSIEDFKNYLNEKKSKITIPERIVHDENFKDLSTDFLQDDFPIIQPSRPIAEQIERLSPEMKALILSGVLDKKY